MQPAATPAAPQPERVYAVPAHGSLRLVVPGPASRHAAQGRRTDPARTVRYTVLSRQAVKGLTAAQRQLGVDEDTAAGPLPFRVLSAEVNGAELCPGQPYALTDNGEVRGVTITPGFPTAANKAVDTTAIDDEDDNDDADLTLPGSAPAFCFVRVVAAPELMRLVVCTAPSPPAATAAAGSSTANRFAHTQGATFPFPGVTFGTAFGSKGALTGEQLQQGAAALLYHGPAFASSLLQVHAALQPRREHARKDKTGEGLGPRVFVCSGSHDSGKSAACRTLANYAVRSGYHPLLLSLDHTLPGTLGLPSCVAASVAQHALGPEEEAGHVPVLARCLGTAEPEKPATFPSTSINVKCVPNGAKAFGYSAGIDGMSPLEPASVAAKEPAAEDNRRETSVWANCVESLLDSAERRTMRFVRTRVAGAIIDGPAWDGTQEGVERLVHAIVATDADMVVCLGSDDLRQRLATLLYVKASGPTTTTSVTPAQAMPPPNAPAGSAAAAAQGLASSAAAATAGYHRVRSPRGVDVTFTTIPQCPNAIRRTLLDRGIAHDAQWRRYFYGTVTSPVTPTRIDVPLHRCRFVKLVLGGKAAAAGLDGLLPLDDAAVSAAQQKQAGGAGPDADSGELNTALRGVDVDEVDLRRRVLGVATPSTEDPFTSLGAFESDPFVRGGAVCGFVVVLGVTPQVVSLLSPTTALPPPRTPLPLIEAGDEKGWALLVTEVVLGA